MKVGVMVVGLSLLGAMPLTAQTPRAEVVAGYAFMHEQDRSEDFPAGWMLTATGNVNDWIAGVAEIGGHYRTCENCQRGPFDTREVIGTDANLRIFTFMAGPRFAARPNPMVTPFFQVLVGGSHASNFQWDGALSTGFTYQPGAGVDISLTDTFGLRIQGDYRVIRAQGVNNRQTRFAFGVVYKAGEL